MRVLVFCTADRVECKVAASGGEMYTPGTRPQQQYFAKKNNNAWSGSSKNSLTTESDLFRALAIAAAEHFLYCPPSVLVVTQY